MDDYGNFADAPPCSAPPTGSHYWQTLAPKQTSFKVQGKGEGTSYEVNRAGIMKRYRERPNRAEALAGQGAGVADRVAAGRIVAGRRRRV